MATQYESPPDFLISLDLSYAALLRTNHGDIAIELIPEHSPTTVNNFVFLARDGFYDGAIFHRVIENFMIQGGDPTGTGRGGPGYSIRDELEGPGNYTRGTVAMANAGPNTSGSQFFICHVNVSLPHAYTIFGEVKSGIEVVDLIARAPTDSSDRPDTECTILRVDITES